MEKDVTKGILKKRSGIGKSLRLFSGKGRVATVAFIGGSITEMKGYVPLTMEALEKRYPGTEFDFIKAGLSSTCSDTGAFRLEKDVFSKGIPDLLFIEFAVNDNQDGHLEKKATVRAMEGMVRQAWKKNKKMDIVFLYTANENHCDSYAKGRTPKEISAQEKVASYYGIPSVNFAKDVGERIAGGEFTFEGEFGGVHPAPFGCKIYCDHILALFDLCKGMKGRKIEKLPPLLDKASLVNGRFLPPEKVKMDSCWTIGLPDWESLNGVKRAAYTFLPMLYSDTVGSCFSYDFKGNTIGLFLTAGPDAGKIAYRIDEGKWKKQDLFHPFSAGLHYPYTKILANGLSAGNHTLTVKILPRGEDPQTGTAVRIAYFAVNTSEK